MLTCMLPKIPAPDIHQIDHDLCFDNDVFKFRGAAQDGAEDGCLAMSTLFGASSLVD